MSAEPRPPAGTRTPRGARSGRPPRRALKVAALISLTAGVGLLLTWLLTRVPVVETVNAIGAVERCVSCHPAGALRAGPKPHPAVPGHPRLAKLGCTACHGGRPLELSLAAVHRPGVGGAPDPFIPLPQIQFACARCHVPGALRGAESLNRGQRSYLEASCPSCHQPGAHPRRFGLDLTLLPQRDPAYLRQHLIDPRALNPLATMWTLRDATYRGRFADDPAGRQRTDDLVVYTLALADRIQRQRWAPAWQPRKLRIDRPCTECHAGAGPSSGAPHRCPELAHSAVLACSRCHARPAAKLDKGTRPSLCPQIRGALFRCGACHLRADDGHRELLERALQPDIGARAALAPEGSP